MIYDINSEDILKDNCKFKSTIYDFKFKVGKPTNKNIMHFSVINYMVSRINHAQNKYLWTPQERIQKENFSIKNGKEFHEKNKRFERISDKLVKKSNSILTNRTKSFNSEVEHLVKIHKESFEFKNSNKNIVTPNDTPCSINEKHKLTNMNEKFSYKMRLKGDFQTQRKKKSLHFQSAESGDESDPKGKISIDETSSVKDDFEIKLNILPDQGNNKDNTLLRKRLKKYTLNENPKKFRFASRISTSKSSDIINIKRYNKMIAPNNSTYIKNNM